MLRYDENFDRFFDSITPRLLRRHRDACGIFLEISGTLRGDWKRRRKMAAQSKVDVKIGEHREKRAAGRSRVDGETPNDWFKRNAYRLIRLYVRADKVDLFERIIKEQGRHTAGQNHVRDHPFKMGLLAMFPDADGLKRYERRRFAEQMLYAHLHKIKPELLNAFSARVGVTEEIKRKLNSDEREPGFKAPTPT